MRIGYACINLELAEQKIQVNRSMVRKTFLSKGIAYASEIALKNIQDLSKIIDWNIKQKLFLYRLSSDMFPWMSEYEIEQLPHIGDIQKIMDRIGQKVKEGNMRLTYHPGHFNVLATNNPVILTNTIKELRQHGEIMDRLHQPPTPFAKINIHVGAAYGDKVSAMERFVENFKLLPENVRNRLTVENDDKENMFSVKDLEYLHHHCRIPVVFDYLHHQFCTGGLSEEQAMSKACDTWSAGIPPVIHFSSQKKRFEDKAAAEVAHADYIYSRINLYGRDADVMLEAKAKEKATLRYVKDYRVRLS